MSILCCRQGVTIFKMLLRSIAMTLRSYDACIYIEQNRKTVQELAPQKMVMNRCLMAQCAGQIDVRPRFTGKKYLLC